MALGVYVRDFSGITYGPGNDSENGSSREAFLGGPESYCIRFHIQHAYVRTCMYV